MKESETDEILFSNISYLKQFRLNKMGAEVVISDRFLISKFLKGLTHCAVSDSSKCTSIFLQTVDPSSKYADYNVLKCNSGSPSTSRPCPNKRAECWSCQRANPPPRLRCQSPASRHLGPRAGWELLHGHHHHEGHHPPHYGHFFSHTKTPGWEFLQIHHHHCTALCCTRLAYF